MKKPFMLMILDGFGLKDEAFGNAIAAASTPNLDKIFETYPFAQLRASGLAVGLRLRLCPTDRWATLKWVT